MSQSIKVQIRAATTKAESTVGVSGSITHVVTEDEKKRIFQINEEVVGSAIKKYFGKKPDDLYMHGPTPWNNLYKTNGWDEVSMTILPCSAQIVSTVSQPLVVSTGRVKNANKDGEETVDYFISGTVQSSVRSSWSCQSKKALIAIHPRDGEQVQYEVKSIGASRESNTSHFSRGLGTKPKETEMRTLESPVSVHLKPKEQKTVSLVARRSLMKVKVTYQAFLSGSIAVNYNKAYRGQNFWALDVESVLAAAGLRSVVTFEETIELDHVCNACVSLNGHSEQRLPLSALSVGSGTLTTKKVVKKRLRSLQSLRAVAENRGSYGGDGPSILNLSVVDPACSMPPVSLNLSTGSKHTKNVETSSMGSDSSAESSSTTSNGSLKESGASLTVSGASLTGSGTSLAGSGTSIAGSGAPITGSGVSLAGSATSFPPMNAKGAKGVKTFKREVSMGPSRF